MRFNPISLVGGILGLVSLPMPWLSLSVTTSGFSTSTSISGLGILFSLGSLPTAGAQLTSGQGGAALLVVVGVIIVLIGAILSFLHPSGGIVLFVGAALALSGALLFRQSISPLGFAIAAGPGFGVFLAIIGGIVAVCGFAMPKEAPRPFYPGAPMVYVPGAVPPPYSYYPWAPPAPPAMITHPHDVPPPVTAPSPSAASASPPTVAEASPSAASPLPASNRVCPACGQRSEEPFCARDGAATRPG